VNESFEYFTISHWRALHFRVILLISLQHSNDRSSIQQPSLQYSPSSSSPLSGTDAHPVSKFGGNVHDRDRVNINVNRAHNDHPVHATKNVAGLRRVNHTSILSMNQINRFALTSKH
jgi:hypothetical protein